MDAPRDCEGPRLPGGDGPPGGTRETSRQLSREQLFVLISAASINLGSMMCYSILGPFFPKEAEKKGASNTVTGMIFGCYALFDLLASLVFGKYCVGPSSRRTGIYRYVFSSENSRRSQLCGGNNCVFFYSCKGFSKQCGHGVDSDPGEHSFWKLITLPKIALIAFVINSLSSCFGFLDPTLSLFVLEKFNLPAGYVGLVFLGLAVSYAISSPLFGLLSDKIPHLRKWFLVLGNIITAGCYMLLGPIPVLHIQSQLWLLVLILVLNGVSAGMSVIPTFPEILSCAYENGFEEGLSTLGLVSGLFSAMWSVGAFIGPTLGGFLYEKIGFEWAAAVQGLWALTSGLAMGLFYLWEHAQRRRSKLQNILGTEEEQTALLPDEI
ncbi:MFS-type transporter SLC18B1 isoform X4 [Acinonyx jubatus]|uniref:MFS-type transporter SLC18B1 isoform X4 n=1 Tax=Acinonyx jubatus TaxID=32536 RepID=A0ABM3Q2Q0_ACIJB|nr:MFS-type transporter SLC18B1 isoform X4 [Acinonyx jubatus]